jgi:hypothetical protein
MGRLVSRILFEAVAARATGRRVAFILVALEAKKITKTRYKGESI